MEAVTRTARDLLKKALELSEDERVKMSRTLLESVGGDDADEHEVSPAWRAELERRIADAADPEKWVPGEDAVGKLRRAQRSDEAGPRPERARGK